MWIATLGAALAVAGAALERPAAAQSEPAADTTQSSARGRAGRLGVGLAVGNLLRAVGKYRVPALPVAVSAGIGTGLFDRLGFAVDAEVTAELALGPVDLSLGGGGRYERHRFAPASLDETGGDTHAGLRAVAAAGWRPLARLEIFGEAAGDYDAYRSSSCTLLSGVDSVCPHDAESRFGVQLAVGARYWLDL